MTDSLDALVTTRLIVRRDRRGRRVPGRILLRLDGRTVGRLGNPVAFEVRPGPHVLRTRCWGIRSEPAIFHVAAGEVVSAVVTTRPDLASGFALGIAFTGRTPPRPAR